MRRQHTKARPDFDDALISIGQDGGYNFAHDIFVVQKILPGGFFALEMSGDLESYRCAFSWPYRAQARSAKLNIGNLLPEGIVIALHLRHNTPAEIEKFDNDLSNSNLKQNWTP